MGAYQPRATGNTTNEFSSCSRQPHALRQAFDHSHHADAKGSGAASETLRRFLWRQHGGNDRMLVGGRAVVGSRTRIHWWYFRLRVVDTRPSITSAQMADLPLWQNSWGGKFEV